MQSGVELDLGIHNDSDPQSNVYTFRNAVEILGTKWNINWENIFLYHH